MRHIRFLEIFSYICTLKKKTDDVRDLLLGEYDVDAETAERDAQAWVARLKTCNLVEE